MAGHIQVLRVLSRRLLQTSISQCCQLKDLPMAERSTLFKALNGAIAEKAEDTLGRYDELSAISQSVGVDLFHSRYWYSSIAKSCYTEIVGSCSTRPDRHDWPPASAYALGNAETRRQAYEHLVGCAVLRIHISADECGKVGLSEAAWKDRNNDRLFLLVVRHQEYNGCTNM